MFTQVESIIPCMGQYDINVEIVNLVLDASTQVLQIIY